MPSLVERNASTLCTQAGAERTCIHQRRCGQLNQTAYFFRSLVTYTYGIRNALTQALDLTFTQGLSLFTEWGTPYRQRQSCHPCDRLWCFVGGAHGDHCRDHHDHLSCLWPQTPHQRRCQPRSRAIGRLRCQSRARCRSCCRFWWCTSLRACSRDP